MSRPIVWFDMDGVLADFGSRAKEIWTLYGDTYEHNPDEAPNAFRDLPLVPGAKDAVLRMHDSARFDLYIASTASWGNPTALQDKREWVEMHFGDIFYKRIVFTHHKNLLRGDYLIDDRTHNGAGAFEGIHLHFGVDYKTGKPNPFPDWASILNYFAL